MNPSSPPDQLISKRRLEAELIRLAKPVFRLIIQMELLFLMTVLLIAFGAAAAQSDGLPHPLQSYAGLPHTQSSNNQVLLRFHLVKKGSNVDDLRPEEVQVLEDGTPREVVFFQGPRTASQRNPVELILLIDRNGCDHIFTQRVLGAKDFAFPDQLASISIFAFGEKLIRYCAPTRDLRMLYDAILEIFHSPNTLATLLYEAIAEICRRSVEIGDREAPRSIVILSNGLPTRAEAQAKDALHKASEKDALREAVKRNITLYPVLFCSGRFFVPDDEVTNSYQWHFAGLGAASGGRSFDLRTGTPDTIASLLQVIAADLQSEYVLGYQSASLRTPGVHRARIMLRDKSRGELRGGERRISQ